MELSLLALVAFAFLAGSVPFGYLVTLKLTGQDVRASGSGNIGATNVARVAGKRAAAVVLALDAGKGALPVALCGVVLPATASAWAPCGVAFAAFLGHVFSPWLGFKGGKGVATALGVLAVLLPWAALSGFVAWGLVLAVSRVSSVASLAGGLVAVVVALAHYGLSPPTVLAGVLLGAMVVTHRDNVRRLLARREHRL